jgi:MoaA/NifB/PqqE/SkfB family radical SAM enzyme
LSFQEIKNFFERSGHFSWIHLTGGEIFLRPDLLDIVKVILDQCPRLLLLNFPTNGFLTKTIVSTVEKILTLSPPELFITVSMDGDERVNDFVRGVEGGWRRQIETYRSLHEIPGVQVVLGMTVSSLNADQYDKAFAAAAAQCPWLEPQDLHMNVAHESAHYYGNTGSGILDDGREKIIAQVGRYRALRGLPLGPIAMLESRYLRHAETYLCTGLTPMRCHALSSSCFVDSSGTVYPCGMYDTRIASLRDYDLDLQTVWNLPRTRELQGQIWAYQCPQCWTPCEAYQSIWGNLLGLRNRPVNRDPSAR